MQEMMKKERSEIQIEIPVINYKRGDLFVSYCPHLDLMTYAAKESDLDKYFDETLTTFFENEVEQNTLNTTMLALGWQMEQKIDRPKTVNIPTEMFENLISNRSVPVTIPC